MKRSIVLAGLALALSWSGAASAAEGKYASRPVRLLIPFAPGGGADTLARILSPKLFELLGQPWVVDNRGGAAGNLAAEIVARAAPDGYTQLIFGSVAASLAQVNVGKLCALATTGAKRSKVAPELPTIAESGFPGFDVGS